MILFMNSWCRFLSNFIIFHIVIVFGLFSLIEDADCHPHIFIENEIVFVFDKKGIAGFEINWLFDEMTSAGFIMDYDANRDGKISADEAKVLKKEAFDHLKNYNYMVHISIDYKNFDVKYVRDFKPFVLNSKLVYQFFVPCHISAIRQFKLVNLSVYDDEYFINFSIKKNSIRVKQSQGFNYDLKLKINRDKSYYFGQFHPQEIIFRFKKK